jgi:serine/threonine-protein kinase
MTSERYQRVKEVFLAVCDRPANEQDDEAVRLCGDDAELRAEVKSLLESHRNASDPAATNFLSQTEEIQRSQLTEPEPAENDSPAPIEHKHSSHHSIQPPPASHVQSRTPRSGTHHRSGSGDSTPRGRFESGTVLDDRYRIISLLGLGGMGEVYRAEDLTLDQPVALKFLPQSFQDNPSWLERFHNEVRMARQVTHPNVCRVFDIGEVDGQQFISMEFVDGEDLASLLRRIGRLPRDKAIQIARQLCAGLAAAHDKGVLHRDLKPANIMLDGRGDVRITDFGISGRVDAADGDTAAGTPAYMAPEQFSQGEATVRSDIYSLGLVLYEVFTGRQAFSAHSMPEYARMHRQTSPTHPSTFVQDMDPLAERVILKCLEKDPAKRPPSALAVAAALPGGDPLAAVLAAGETPSPEMVAAAGDTAGMTPIRAGILLGLTVVGMIGAVLLSARAMVLPHMTDPVKPPAVLADYARQILVKLGYADAAPRSKASGFAVDEQYTTWLHASNPNRDRWNSLATARPGAIFFWYRESPQFMVSKDDIGMVTLDEPARAVPGMRTVTLDTMGRLKRLEILPDSRHGKRSALADQVDFSPLFEAAGLGQVKLTAVDPVAIPPMFATKQYAWDTAYPENPSQRIHVEAASLDGKPVYLSIRESWQDEADKMGIEVDPDLPTGRNIFLQATLIIAATASSLLLAWRNIRAGRGDSGGAQKLAGLFLVLGLLVWLLCANHVPQLFLEMRSFFRVLGFILVPAAIVWMFYLALEPYVRKTWPETVISWSRALSGKLVDPVVASHVLAGLAVGIAATILAELTNLLPMHYGRAAAIPNITQMVKFLAKENPTATALWALLNSLYMGLLFLLVLVLFLIVFRRKWAAGVGLVVLGAFYNFQWYNAGWVQLAQSALVMVLILVLLVRYGLVAAIAGFWCMTLFRYLPITPDMTVWYSNQTRYAVILVSVLAVAAATLGTGRWKFAPRAIT